MKKIVFLLFIIMFISIISSSNQKLLIPKEAIRIRVIANSNSIDDQKNKILIKDEVTSLLNSRLDKVDNYNDARNIINKNLMNIKNIVEKYYPKYDINFGNNYFPTKEYKGVTYNEGNYESLVIELGDAKGENFWCILFPPVCKIDEENLSDAQYEFYILNLLKKIK